MVRHLKRLRIDEVSAVTRGANDGARIVISKRDDDEPLCACEVCSRFRAEAAVGKAAASTATPHQQRLREVFGAVGTIDFRKSRAAAPEADDNQDNDNDQAEQGQLPERLEQMIAAVIAASPNSMTPQEALNYLLHSRNGRELARHLASTMKRKDQSMDRASQLKSIAKQYGLAAVAKRVIADGNAHSISEAEFTELINAEAQATRKAGERPAIAFDRYFNDPANVELRKAHRLTRGF